MKGKLAVERMIRHDILQPWTIANWGETGADLVPRVSLGTTERQDLAAVMTAVAALARAGGIHPSQWASIDKMLSLPVRDLSRDDDPESSRRREDSANEIASRRREDS